MENFPTWLQILIVLLPAVGAARLIELAVTRRIKRNDKAQYTTVENEAHSLAADTQFRADLMNRLKTVETEHKELQTKFNEQGIENAGLKIESKHLQNTNTRQETELDRLRIRNIELETQIKSLEQKFAVMKAEFTIVTTNYNTLQNQIRELQSGRDVEIEKEILRRMGMRPVNFEPLIAIVDDDEPTRDLFKAVLTDADVDHATFANGRDAINWLRDNEATCIVVDLALGGDIDGLSLVERVRGHERRNRLIPSRIILYTGYPVSETIKADADKYSVEMIATKSKHTPDKVLSFILGRDALGE